MAVLRKGKSRKMKAVSKSFTTNCILRPWKPSNQRHRGRNQATEGAGEGRGGRNERMRPNSPSRAIRQKSPACSMRGQAWKSTRLKWRFRTRPSQPDHQCRRSMGSRKTPEFNNSIMGIPSRLSIRANAG
ncbi:hypothetical protein FNV43_RR08171 [Rhamnella rubrinervis]|uniref:Uncharacterized protein n=1 Tax=Rhamnella rubrinervis TaxID=2594499 RepID=A0A8K0MNP3_9ROSA|nr:hypothetical protein FNV43_RR08171 [Rhamnella rubrinervis]